jgi:GT2 family glycosyltransferase
MGSQIDWNNIYGSNFGIDEVDHGQFDHRNLHPDFISGCCFLVNKDFFKTVGLFDDKFYLYLEDADLSQRAKKLGYHLKIVPQSVIWHLNSGSSGAASPLHDYFLTRNRLIFSSRYASLRTKFAVFRESVKHLLIGRQWQKIAVKDFYLGRLGKGSWK